MCPRAVRVLTFDRYLLRNFAYVFAVCFVAMFGLLIVIDLLENLDEFLAKNGDSGTQTLLQTIVRYYSFQAIFFLDRAGPSLTLISVAVVLILFQRNGELHPLLAAGIPMYRVVLPLVMGGAAVCSLLVLNQELVIPQVAFAAHESRGGKMSQLQVEPVYDHASRISIDGQGLQLAQKTISTAEFVLPAPFLVGEMTRLQATEAIHRPARRGRPSGWLLKNVSPQWTQLSLTEEGKRLVLPVENPQDLFVATPVTVDQLYRRNSSYALLSSQELLRRIQSPAFGSMAVQRLVTHLHSRFVQPLLNMIAILLVIPLIVRRESTGLVVDSAMCGTVLAAMFGLTQGCLYFGQVQLMPPDIAAWIPVIVGGSWAAWLSGVIRT